MRIFIFNLYLALITVPTTSERHTLDKCQQCDSPTSITANSDDNKPTEGVSLKNALLPTDISSKGISTPTIDTIISDDFVQPNDYKWFFLRVNYNRAAKFYKEQKDLHKEYCLWMPCQKTIKYTEGKKIESLEPIFKSNLFIYATYDQAFDLTHRSTKGYPYVDFAYDHTVHNKFGRDLVITIPFNEMKNFIKAENVHHPWAHVVEPEKIHFREGGKVKVIGGFFEGVEGYVARVFGQTRVIVTIKGIVNYATAYISQKYLLPLDEDPSKDEGEKPEAGNSIRNRVIRHEVKMGGYITKEQKSSMKKNKQK